ncbi:hypothetical protein Ahy_A06g030171 [Arachis hypogaea]|uniref:MULE transposase domain-containing protein n=1 Tax=Arachis hypogaea TaxID=3818 RepID=A0A445CVG6_ARAHY|nr:hypothetical protein Ahy_A06g030171 [Arachis hypogaea]
MDQVVIGLSELVLSRESFVGIIVVTHAPNDNFSRSCQAKFRHITEMIKALVEVDPSLKASYEVLPSWFEAMVQKDLSAVVEIKTAPAYQGNEVVQDIRILTRMSCKPIVQIDDTHLYGKYKGALLVAVSQSDNDNIVPLAYVIVEGENSDA